MLQRIVMGSREGSGSSSRDVALLITNVTDASRTFYTFIFLPSGIGGGTSQDSFGCVPLASNGRRSGHLAIPLTHRAHPNTPPALLSALSTAHHGPYHSLTGTKFLSL